MLLEKLTLNKIGFVPTFRDIRMKFRKNLTIVVYNLTTNTTEYLSADNYPDMPCLTALRMTTNVPILFERYFYNNCEYIDGGLVDNFPITCYDQPGNKIIGININPRNMTSTKKNNYISYILQIALIPYTFFHTQRKVPESATVIEIDTGVNTFDFDLNISKRLDLFSKGYQTVRKFFEKEKANEDDNHREKIENHIHGVEEKKEEKTEEKKEDKEEKKEEKEEKKEEKTKKEEKNIKSPVIEPVKDLNTIEPLKLNTPPSSPFLPSSLPLIHI